MEYLDPQTLVFLGVKVPKISENGSCHYDVVEDLRNQPENPWIQYLCCQKKFHDLISLYLHLKICREVTDEEDFNLDRRCIELPVYKPSKARRQNSTSLRTEVKMTKTRKGEINGASEDMETKQKHLNKTEMLQREQKKRELNRLRVQQHRHKVKMLGREAVRPTPEVSCKGWTEEEIVARSRELCRLRTRKYRLNQRRECIPENNSATDQLDSIEVKIQELERLRELNRIRVQRHRAKVINKLIEGSTTTADQSNESSKSKTLKSNDGIQEGMDRTRKQDHSLRQTQQHTGPTKFKSKVFICSICGKPFTSGQSLRLHEQKHGDRRYECVKCGKLFLHKTDLTRHIGYVHNTAEMLNVCDICGKEYNHKKSLHLHKRTHTDPKSIVCKICGRKCSRECAQKDRR